jgi:hypothetical protein
MSSQVTINSYISANNWRSLATFLESQHGFIDNTYGGRYICDAQRNTVHDRSDINKICWDVFHASQRNEFKQLPHNERLAVRNVIRELRRLYDETGNALAKTSGIPFIVTRVYDIYEHSKNCYQPIHLIEEIVVYEANQSTDTPDTKKSS